MLLIGGSGEQRFDVVNWTFFVPASNKVVLPKRLHDFPAPVATDLIHGMHKIIF